MIDNCKHRIWVLTTLISGAFWLVLMVVASQPAYSVTFTEGDDHIVVEVVRIALVPVGGVLVVGQGNKWEAEEAISDFGGEMVLGLHLNSEYFETVCTIVGYKILSGYTALECDNGQYFYLAENQGILPVVRPDENTNASSVVGGLNADFGDDYINNKVKDLAIWTLWKAATRFAATQSGHEYLTFPASESHAVVEAHAPQIDIISSVQLELSGLGYNVGVVDGMMGPKTRAAIEAYQNAHGLPVDGMVTESLLRDLKAANMVALAVEETVSPEFSDSTPDIEDIAEQIRNDPETRIVMWGTKLLEHRGDILFMVKEDEPFTGITFEEHENGNTKSEFNYVSGELNGPATLFYENGRKQSMAMHVDGYVEGTVIEWWENGNRKREHTVRNGRIQGRVTQWLENGELFQKYTVEPR